MKKTKKVTATNTRSKDSKSMPSKIVMMSESQVKGFVDFIRTQGVIGLAVGLVLGGAVSVLVKSLIDNIVMPPLGLLLGSAEGVNGLSLVIGNNAAGDPAMWNYGIFLNDLINFLVIALVIYVLIRGLKLDKLDLKK